MQLEPGTESMDEPGSMNSAGDLFGAVQAALALAEGQLALWALAWARFVPTIMLVPAFGLRALPAAVRVVLGLALSAAVPCPGRERSSRPWGWPTSTSRSAGRRPG